MRAVYNAWHSTGSTGWPRGWAAHLMTRRQLV